jgi:putative chitinase
MIVTVDQIKKLAPNIGHRASVVADSLSKAMSTFGINTPKRAAHFLAQVAHESSGFSRKSENLNYTPAAIIATFNGRTLRFTKEQAERYGRTDKHIANQEMIASIAYANRMGNGDVESRDGWKYRGMGYIQLTGKNNQFACADYFKIDRAKIGDWLCSELGAAMSAAWFWDKNNINKHADADSVDNVSDVINMGSPTAKVGDSIGYKHRLEMTDIAKKALS